MTDLWHAKRDHYRKYEGNNEMTATKKQMGVPRKATEDAGGRKK